MRKEVKCKVGDGDNEKRKINFVMMEMRATL